MYRKHVAYHITKRDYYKSPTVLFIPTVLCFFKLRQMTIELRESRVDGRYNIVARFYPNNNNREELSRREASVPQPNSEI